MLWKLFENLRDGYGNPKEVLKNQARFKLVLCKVKTGHENSPLLPPFLSYEKQLLIFLENILFCYLKLTTKNNMERNLKY